MAGPSSVEEYLSALPEESRAYLQELRRTILSVLPDPTETISYQMPAVTSGGRVVVWYAAFKEHYSLFPATDGVKEALGEEVEPYLAGKGTIRLPLEKPVPVELVKRIVRVRLEENAATGG